MTIINDTTSLYIWSLTEFALIVTLTKENYRVNCTYLLDSSTGVCQHLRNLLPSIRYNRIKTSAVILNRYSYSQTSDTWSIGQSHRIHFFDGSAIFGIESTNGIWTKWKYFFNFSYTDSKKDTNTVKKEVISTNILNNYKYLRLQ